MFCNFNHNLINDLVFQSCQRGLYSENAFDRLLAIHILEEFARLHKHLEKNHPLLQFSYKGHSYQKDKFTPFYLENLVQNKKDFLRFKFNRCPSNPSIFLLDSFAYTYDRLRPELAKLTKEEISQIYEDQSASIEDTINNTLPIEKRLQQVKGEISIGTLMNNQILHLFKQRDGEEIVMMTDQALNCLKNLEGILAYSNINKSDILDFYSFRIDIHQKLNLIKELERNSRCVAINKDEIWKSYFDEQNSWSSYFFSSSEPSYAPLLTWYLVIGWINEYDNFFVPLPTGWFEQAKELFSDTYYTREEDYSGRDIRATW